MNTAPAKHSTKTCGRCRFLKTAVFTLHREKWLCPGCFEIVTEAATNRQAVRPAPTVVPSPPPATAAPPPRKRPEVAPKLPRALAPPPRREMPHPPERKALARTPGTVSSGSGAVGVPAPAPPRVEDLIPAEVATFNRELAAGRTAEEAAIKEAKRDLDEKLRAEKPAPRVAPVEAGRIEPPLPAYPDPASLRVEESRHDPGKWVVIERVGGHSWKPDGFEEYQRGWTCKTEEEALVLLTFVRAGIPYPGLGQFIAALELHRKMAATGALSPEFVSRSAPSPGPSGTPDPPETVPAVAGDWSGRPFPPPGPRLQAEASPEALEAFNRYLDEAKVATAPAPGSTVPLVSSTAGVERMRDGEPLTPAAWGAAFEAAGQTDPEPPAVRAFPATGKLLAELREKRDGLRKELTATEALIWELEEMTTASAPNTNGLTRRVLDALLRTRTWAPSSAVAVEFPELPAKRVAEMLAHLAAAGKIERRPKETPGRGSWEYRHPAAARAQA